MSRGGKVALAGFLISVALLAVLAVFCAQPSNREMILMAERGDTFVNFPGYLRWTVLLLFVLNVPAVLVDQALVSLMARMLSLTPAQGLSWRLGLLLPLSALWWWGLVKVVGVVARKRRPEATKPA